MSQEMYSELFKDTWTTLAEFRVLGETVKQANRLIGENGWGIDEGMQIIFVNGLNYLLGQKRIEGFRCDEDELAGEVKRLTQELMDMQSKYAVMKFRAYTLDEAKQALDFNTVALERENVWSGARLKKFGEDEELLKAELRAVKAERDHLQQRLALVEAPQAQQATPGRQGLLRGLLRLFGK